MRLSGNLMASLAISHSLAVQPAIGLSEIAGAWFQHPRLIIIIADVRLPVTSLEVRPDSETANLWTGLLQQRRTPLGRRLQALRDKLVATGVPLLDWDGIANEVAARRGQSER